MTYGKRQIARGALTVATGKRSLLERCLAPVK